MISTSPRRIHVDLFADSDDEKLAEVLNLEPCDRRWVCRIPRCLCALERFAEEPTPDDCTESLDGDLFAYLVCYEGEAGWHRPRRRMAAVQADQDSMDTRHWLYRGPVERSPLEGGSDDDDRDLERMAISVVEL